MITGPILTLNLISVDFEYFGFIPKLNSAEADAPKTHLIKMAAVQLQNNTEHEGNIYAYKMIEHLIESPSKDNGKGNSQIQNVTDRYSPHATIPGPTLVIDEGDIVNITLYNHIGHDHMTSGCVSLHSHGVHYGIESDGTVALINGLENECATHGSPYSYTWKASKGKSGTWPYHDHTLGLDANGHQHEMAVSSLESFELPHGSDINGSSSKGLFGALIINPKDPKVPAQIDGTIKNVSLKEIEKEIILYMIGTRFYGMEIDNSDYSQKPLWENPNIIAKLNDKVRFHVITLGTNSDAFHKMASEEYPPMNPSHPHPAGHAPEEFHTFHIHGHSWLEQGTSRILDTRTSGPAESTQFVIKAGESVGTGDWMYHCHVFHHMTSGMWGKFTVSNQGGESEAGYGWHEMMMHHG